ncbi:hypothetical protein NP233_g9662 [Leucocoprinus birnbaumii]|uniref:LysM domain-containing protein n=1 Tax=Leucocoprinus birnbaumii TaxID=56174 RepID=A0AAD5VMB6_9AGAR|nr:hypothetical protein NP233_g9662 [Leucocoprinus birnbaumii]
MFKLLASIAFTFAAVSLGVHAQDEDQCNRFYTVQSGDTCDRIGKNEKAPSWQIRFENSDYINVDCTNLYPGESLCLGVVGRDCQLVHVVAAGETCDEIAALSGLTPEGFQHANWRAVGDDCSIYAGEVLCVDPAFAVTS